MIGVALVLAFGIGFGLGIGLVVRAFRTRPARLRSCPYPCGDPAADRAAGVGCIFPLACSLDRKEQSCAKS